MSSSNLVRLGGVAAVVTGLIFVVLFILFNPEQGLATDTFFSGPLSTVLFIVALLGQLPGIAGLHTLQRGLYGRLGAAGSLVAFVGFALLLIIGIAMSLIGDANPAITVVLALLFLLGVLAPFVGLALLGVATLRARVLPSWLGVLLIVGLPVVAILIGSQLIGGSFWPPSSLIPIPMGNSACCPGLV